jgi:hypothetical protein
MCGTSLIIGLPIAIHGKDKIAACARQLLVDAWFDPDVGVGDHCGTLEVCTRAHEGVKDVVGAIVGIMDTRYATQANAFCTVAHHDEDLIASYGAQIVDSVLEQGTAGDWE